MAEKKLTTEELNKVGIVDIEMTWDNKQKLTALFHHFVIKKEPLPASGVNDHGDAIANLSKLARLGKIKQGKQIFKALYAREMLNVAIKKCGIEDLAKNDEGDETKVVREHLQSGIDEARRYASDADKKLIAALNKVDALTAKVAELEAHLALAKIRAGDAEKRNVKGEHIERQSLRRVF
ncbi:hypothetical protein [uncultured Alteromonas sp.]|uniref:hypothetical protein n=1 Tax=uncultured Alteromonas sp. TaxID=179113 RepID=UPI0030D10773|tara:strand:- start:1412 stop:1951 length:540 start_codon:yes stop_codon:yes gene_type:complete